MKQFALAILILLTFVVLPISGEEGAFDAEIENIQGQLMRQFPIGSRVLILDMTDLSGVITPFGRYLSNKLNIRLSSYREIELVDRMGIEFAHRGAGTPDDRCCGPEESGIHASPPIAARLLTRN